MIGLLPDNYFVSTTAEADDKPRILTSNKYTQTESSTSEQYTQTDNVITPRKTHTALTTKWFNFSILAWKTWTQIENTVLKNTMVAKIWHAILRHFKYVMLFVVMFVAKFGKKSVKGMAYLFRKTKMILRLRPALF